MIFYNLLFELDGLNLQEADTTCGSYNILYYLYELSNNGDDSIVKLTYYVYFS